MSSFRYPLDEIREKCDLVEIVSAHVALRKGGSGGRLIGLCPFHNEKTPSFTVNPVHNLWHCFGCGEGGDIFEFVRKIDNLTFPEAVEQLARKCGITIERSEKAAKQYSERECILRANNIACAFYRNWLEKSSKAKEYLAKRGLMQPTIEKYRLGYAPDSWDELSRHLISQKVSQADALKAGLIVPRQNSQGFYDRFRDRLIFPILDSSERVIAFGGRTFGDEQPKYLNSPETPLFVKNKTLYGLSFARKAAVDRDRLLVVEGYMDLITAQEAGFENTVATMGTALTEEHVNVIARFTKNVVLAFDADSAGMKAALRSAPIFERSGFSVRILIMPAGEDPDSLLRGGDTAHFAEVLKKALPIPDYRIKLALSKHDLKTDQGKTAALKEATALLAEVESVVERERLINLLARFHPNFSSGTTLAEGHLRTEVERLINRSMRRGPRIETREVEPAAPRKLTLLESSERLLLGIMIFQSINPSKVFDVLPPNEFTCENTRALAEALSSLHNELGKIDMEELRTRIAETPARELLTNLLLGEDESVSDVSIQEPLQTILNCKKRERYERLRSLKDKIAQGLIKKGDEELEEYLRLVRETKGNAAPRVGRRNAI